MIRLYSTNEVANRLKTSDRSVRRRINNGELEAVRLVNTVSGRVTYGISETKLGQFQKNRGK